MTNLVSFIVFIGILAGSVTGGIIVALLTYRALARSKSWKRLPLTVTSGLAVMSLGFLVACVCGVAFFDLSRRVTYELRSRFPALYTNPLDSSVAAQLCNVLKLNPQDSRCQDSDVYIVEFLPDIEAHFEKRSPREQVDLEIGEYLIGCDEWFSTVSDGLFQHCHYDFHGDGVYVLEISYYHPYILDVRSNLDIKDEIWYPHRYESQDCSW
jgi:hypothetical protein